METFLFIHLYVGLITKLSNVIPILLQTIWCGLMRFKELPTELQLDYNYKLLTKIYI